MGPSSSAVEAPAAQLGLFYVNRARRSGPEWVINGHAPCLAGTANVTPLPDVGTGGARHADNGPEQVQQTMEPL